jgi:RNA polymerase sigma factor (TIGR02999 family)
MGQRSADDPTDLLLAHGSGNHAAAERLLPLVYDDLKKIAASYLKGESPGHILEPAAVVHEAYLRLVDSRRIDWQGRTHFLAVAAIQMRKVLRDHARSRKAQKRGGRLTQISFPSDVAGRPREPVEIAALTEALDALARDHERQSRVAELRLFAGMLDREIAHVVGVSERTVRQDWRFARAWLAKQLVPRRSPPS